MAPTAEKGTATKTIKVLASERVFTYKRKKIRQSVIGTTTFKRFLARCMASYCPLQEIE
jgi:hypothetical protein